MRFKRISSVAGRSSGGSLLAHQSSGKQVYHPSAILRASFSVQGSMEISETERRFASSTGMVVSSVLVASAGWLVILTSVLVCEVELAVSLLRKRGKR